MTKILGMSHRHYTQGTANDAAGGTVSVICWHYVGLSRHIIMFYAADSEIMQATFTDNILGTWLSVEA